MAEWTTAYINDLPDSAFACVDGDGRHYPHHDATGKLDLPHLRAALSRIGDPDNAQCGKGHLQAHANVGKALAPMKATLLDDDAFRLLALPYGGPIPYPGAPRGADLDRQWLSERTDFGEPPKTVDVTWHHGMDRTLGREVVGKAGDLRFDDDGGWVTVWLEHGRRRTRLIKQLAEAAQSDPEVDIYGSSEAVTGTALVKATKGELPWRRDIPGEITRWWYSGQTLSTSPQNTTSILQPMKATLADLASAELVPTAAFFDDLAAFIDNLGPDPVPTSPSGSDGTAKAGRVIAGRNEARLREAYRAIDESYYDPKRRRAALAALKDVLDELEQHLKPE
jgi:hypothetical protein